MANSLRDRLKNAWNVFANNKQQISFEQDYGRVSVGLGNQVGFRSRSSMNERTIINAIYNRIAMDVAAADIKHVRVDDNGRYLETIKGPLNDCLTFSPNIDQTARQMYQDAVLTMFEEGSVAIVPTIADKNILTTDSFKVESIRVGVPVEWFPQHVKIRLYNELTGMKEDIVLPKSKVAIVQNPFYTVMNESGSLMQRLLRKLNLLDIVDEQSSSGKLDLIIQLPYTIKSEARRDQAEKRRKTIEDQLAGSKYGIAYADATEHITQLNRSVENNLLKQIEYLTNLAYGQIGVTPEIMNGTAEEKVMTNYNSRVIEPILSAITQCMARAFLSQTARTQGQDIKYFRDPFKLMPISDVAEIADKFTRNEIASSNEIRQAIGMKPSNDPKADALRNANISSPAYEVQYDENGNPIYGDVASQNEYGIENNEDVSDDMTQEEYLALLEQLNDSDAELNELDKELSHSDEEYLEHYASPYYDPVKAHEYYMRTRKLKGKTSTSGLTDEGKEAASYVKNALSTERKTKVKEARAQYNQEKKKAKQNAANTKSHLGVKLAEQTANTSAQIRLIKAKMAHASTEEKLKYKSQVASLKAQNNKIRAAINAQIKAATSSVNSSEKRNALSEKIKRINADYKSRQQSELEKISSDASFQKR